MQLTFITVKVQSAFVCFYLSVSGDCSIKTLNTKHLPHYCQQFSIVFVSNNTLLVEYIQKAFKT